MEDRCVMCGEIIPEGRMVCPVCEERVLTRKGEQTMKTGTRNNRLDQSHAVDASGHPSVIAAGVGKKGDKTCQTCDH